MPETTLLGIPQIVRTILSGILILMILVILHEFGHFFAARKSGVKVLEFGLGIPPKIKKLWTDKKGTQYTLNAIPLGWFVQLKWEDPEKEDTFTAKDSILNVNMFKKTIILLGGIIMNILTAWILFAITFMIGTKPFQIIPDSMMKAQVQSYLMPSHSFALKQGIITNNTEANDQGVKILWIKENLLATTIGLEKWDIITAINTTPTTTENITEVLQKNIGKENTIQYLHNNKPKSTQFTCPKESCILGVIYNNNTQVHEIQAGFFKSFAMAGEEIRWQTKITFNGLGGIFSNLFSGDKEKIKQSTKGLTGPVGAIKVGEIFAKTNGFIAIIAFMGIISLALAIFNLLPIPALDGGRLLGMWIQYLFRLPKAKYFKIEGYINFVFFITLLLVGVLIIFQDLDRYWGVSIPFIG